MAQRTEIFDVGTLGLQSGEGRSLELDVPVLPFDMAGQRYQANEGTVPANLDVSHTTNGYALRLRYDATLHGPCMRCLEDAGRPIEVDVREIDQPGGGDELSSPYMDGQELDVASWARDALLLELPSQIVCSYECRGLCAVCGENLNTAGPEHSHEAAPDPRWAKLNELKLD